MLHERIFTFRNEFDLSSLLGVRGGAMEGARCQLYRVQWGECPVVGTKLAGSAGAGLGGWRGWSGREWEGVWWVRSLDTIGLHLGFMCDCLCVFVSRIRRTGHIIFQGQGEEEDVPPACLCELGTDVVASNRKAQF